VVALACGEGRVIFDVDVFSFLSAGADTIHYTVPLVITDSVKNTPIKVNLPGGLGKSAVDSVTLSGTAKIINNTGSGNVTFKIFIDTSSATTYSRAPFVSTGGPVGPGSTTTPISANATVLGDSRFVNQTLWVGVEALAARRLEAQAFLGSHRVVAPGGRQPPGASAFPDVRLIR
jgi:hypothetical protein